MICNLKQLDDGQFWCPRCDPGKQRLLPVAAQRKCQTYDVAASLKEQIDFALASELATYPPELIRRNLAICRANECGRFTDEGNCLELWRNCKHIHDWFEALCGYERRKRWCRHWGTRPE